MRRIARSTDDWNGSRGGAGHEGTRAVLAAFPDRTLVGEAVIWSGDEEEGYLSSHRITSHATHWAPMNMARRPAGGSTSRLSPTASAGRI
jgi:hypothetical protein